MVCFSVFVFINKPDKLRTKKEGRESLAKTVSKSNTKTHIWMNYKHENSLQRRDGERNLIN